MSDKIETDTPMFDFLIQNPVALEDCKRIMEYMIELRDLIDATLEARGITPEQVAP